MTVPDGCRMTAGLLAPRWGRICMRRLYYPVVGLWQVGHCRAVSRPRREVTAVTISLGCADVPAKTHMVSRAVTTPAAAGRCRRIHARDSRVERPPGRPRRPGPVPRRP